MSCILYAADGGSCFIKLRGEIRHPQGPGFDALLQSVCRDGGPRRFVVDLSEAVYMDSTILGVLAGIARWASSQGLERPVLAGPQPDVCCVLRSMGFDRYFAICDPSRLETEAELRPPPEGSTEHEARAQLVLDAHRELMAMNEKNRDSFHDVVELLSRNVDSGSDGED